MKLKLDEQGNPILDNGLPVFVSEEGKDVPVDVPRLFADIKRLNGESAGRRKEIEVLNEKLAAFQGIEDPEAARKALETVANLDDKELLDAKQVETLKANISQAYENKLTQARQAYEAKLAEMDKTSREKDGKIRRLLIKGAFDSSKFLAEKTVLPPDVAFEYFGRHFEVLEVGGEMKAVAKLNGEVIPSLANPGEPALPEEAIEALIDKYPFRDRILKSSGAQGMGTPPGGGGSGNDKTLTRKQFDNLSAQARMEHVKAGGKVVD